LKFKTNKKYILISFIITIIFFLSITSFLIKNKRNLTFIDKSLKDFIYYASYTIEIPINKLEKIIDEIVSYQKMYDEYNSLKDTASKTDFVMSKYEESLKVIEELESLLDLNSTLVENSYLNATVISRNLGYFYDSIVIDKGSINGVYENMAVVTNEGLIGTVVSVSYTTSDVRLLTNSYVDQKISVKINENDDYSYGLLTKYDSSKKTFTIEGISGNKEINIGATVTTTGLGDNFPSGILVGYVKSITKDHFDLERILEVESKVDFDSIRYVTLLKRNEL
jgi:rod shape-determining protein MreC